MAHNALPNRFARVERRLSRIVLIKMSTIKTRNARRAWENNDKRNRTSDKQTNKTAKS